MERHVAREKYDRFFIMAGAAVLVLGLLLYLCQNWAALDAVKKALSLRKIYDLPIFLMIIGFVLALRVHCRAGSTRAARSSSQLRISARS